jgi:hypothetical protein
MPRSSQHIPNIHISARSEANFPFEEVCPEQRAMAGPRNGDRRTGDEAQHRSHKHLGKADKGECGWMQ